MKISIHKLKFTLVFTLISNLGLLPSLVNADDALNVTTSDRLQLTDNEEKWLTKNARVKFTGDPNWLPFEAFTESGEYIGIVAEHLKLVSQISGLTFDIIPSETWTESTEKAKQGSVDILSETDDSDLKSHLNFTQSYLANPIVIAMRTNQHYVESINSINEKKIALIKDYGYASKIRRKYSSIPFATVNDIHDGLIDVSTGKIDALLCTLALCSYTINQLGLSNVRITGKTEFDTKLAFGVQKNNPILLSILNKSISSISKRQQQLVLDKWIEHEYVAKVDYTIAYVVTAVSIILLSLFIYWIRRMSQEIVLRKEAEKQLISSNEINERYRALFYESKVGHALNRFSTGNFVSVNKTFADITGYNLDELNQLSYWDLTPKEYAEQEAAQIQSLKENGFYGPYEKHYIRKNGKLVPVRLNGTLITDTNGDEIILSMVEDISVYSDAREKLQLSSLVLENSSEAMLITDENNKIIAVNPAYIKTTGYSFEDVKGKDPAEFKSNMHDKHFYQDMWQSIEDTGKWQGEVWDKRKNGDIYAKWLTIDTIKDKQGKFFRYVALFSDITERKHSERLIWKQANYDALTGLPNRSMFQNRLKKQIIESEQNNSKFSLLLIDLDSFKEVNDTLGHDKGDLLLKIAAKRINNCVRETDTVARLGGDEFTIMLPNICQETDLQSISLNLIKHLAEPYHLDEQVVHVSASIGIALYPDDTTELEALIKHADQAMYDAKRLGRNRYSRFTKTLHDKAQQRLRLSNDLRKALQENQFLLYFQPILDLKTNKIAKVETLLRWDHPEQGVLFPEKFISLAEDIGMINEIGSWVCCESIKWKNKWNQFVDPDLQVSINMSPLQFKVSNDTFGKDWLDMCVSTKEKNVNLIIEITESALLNAEPNVLTKLNILRDKGIEISLDDFGTGYSSLSYLRKFHIDYLKIDKSFIQNIENDSNDIVLCEAIVAIAQKLKLKVIAEGIETWSQHELVAKIGCDFGQGFLYSTPVPAEEFELLFNRGYVKKESLVSNSIL